MVGPADQEAPGQVQAAGGKFVSWQGRYFLWLHSISTIQGEERQTQDVLWGTQLKL